MSEKGESLIDTLSKVPTFSDLKAALPPTLTEKLGKGEKGVNRALRLLKDLAPFASEPTIFDRGAFNDVMVDKETLEPLSPEDSQKMMDTALEAGFIKRAPTAIERYIVNPQIRPLVKRLFKE